MGEVALFIGTFDPFHVGHIWQIERTYKHRKFDKLVIAVIKDNPRKPQAIDYKHRENLVWLNVERLSFAFDIEVLILDKIGSSEIEKFVIENIKEKNKFRTVGSDSIINIIKDEERHIEELKKFHYVIGVRDLWNLNQLQGYISNLSPEIKANFSYDILHSGFKNHLTATSIRNNLEDSVVKGLITKEQLSYIIKNKLYK